MLEEVVAAVEKQETEVHVVHVAHDYGATNDGYIRHRADDVHGGDDRKFHIRRQRHVFLSSQTLHRHYLNLLWRS